MRAESGRSFLCLGPGVTKIVARKGRSLWKVDRYCVPVWFILCYGMLYVILCYFILCCFILFYVMLFCYFIFSLIACSSNKSLRGIPRCRMQADALWGSTCPAPRETACGGRRAGRCLPQQSFRALSASPCVLGCQQAVVIPAGYPSGVACRCLTLGGFLHRRILCILFSRLRLGERRTNKQPPPSTRSSGESGIAGDLRARGQRSHGKPVAAEGFKPLACSSVVSSDHLLWSVFLNALKKGNTAPAESRRVCVIKLYTLHQHGAGLKGVRGRRWCGRPAGWPVCLDVSRPYRARSLLRTSVWGGEGLRGTGKDCSSGGLRGHRRAEAASDSCSAPDDWGAETPSAHTFLR